MTLAPSDNFPHQNIGIVLVWMVTVREDVPGELSKWFCQGTLGIYLQGRESIVSDDHGDISWSKIRSRCLDGVIVQLKLRALATTV